MRLRNLPLNTLFGGFNAGGLAGLDNMHPTVPGYALMADEVLAALGGPGPVDKTLAYFNDTLLNGLPRLWFISQAELGLLGSFGVFGSFGGDEEDPIA